MKYSIKHRLYENLSPNASEIFVKTLYSLPQWKPHACLWASQSPSNESLAFNPTPECEIRVFLIVEPNDAIYIARIESAQEYDAKNSRYIEDYDEDCEGKGYGSQCMKQLTDLADQFNVTLTLEPSAFNEDPQQKRPDTDDLASWYQRLGFVYDPDEFMSMIREPVAKQ